MATICLAYGLTPAEYYRLTLEELGAFHALLKEIEKKNRG